MPPRARKDLTLCPQICLRARRAHCSVFLYRCAQGVHAPMHASVCLYRVFVCLFRCAQSPQLRASLLMCALSLHPRCADHEAHYLLVLSPSAFQLFFHCPFSSLFLVCLFVYPTSDIDMGLQWCPLEREMLASFTVEVHVYLPKYVPHLRTTFSK